MALYQGPFGSDLVDDRHRSGVRRVRRSLFSTYRSLKNQMAACTAAAVSFSLPRAGRVVFG